MTQPFKTPYVILRRKQVEARTGLSRSTIYARMAENAFPHPINLGYSKGAVGWIEAEINAWVEAQMQNRSSTFNEVKL